MGVAIILILLITGSVVFHFLSPWWWTPIASNWGGIDDTIILTFWITGAVNIAIILFMAYCLIRYHHKKGRTAVYEPENTKLEWALTIVTSIGVAAMLAPGLLVWHDFIDVPEDATEVEVMGQQWQWSFRYPGKDGLMGTTDAKFITPENPFGLNPEDPNGQDDVLVEADDMHLPTGSPLKFLLRSIDVLHDFYVPEFRAKMDMVPGMVTYFWLTPIRDGTFDILCAELCGIGHHIMRGIVVVEGPDDFQTWLDEQSTFAQTQASLGTAPPSPSRLTSIEDNSGSVEAR